MGKSGLFQRLRSVKYDPLDTAAVFAKKSIPRLASEAVLFKLCGYDALTKAAIRVLRASTGGPFRYLFKKTIFQQFCGGVTMMDCYPVINSLMSDFGVRTILDYSSEEAESADSLDAGLQAKLNSLRSAHESNSLEAHHNGKILFFPLKPTALIDPRVLESITTSFVKLSSNGKYPSDEVVLQSLSDRDQSLFHSGLSRFQTICSEAQEKKISLLLDAEQSYRQPAIELLYRRLAPEYNRLDSTALPVLYNTYQAYLHRTEDAVSRDLQHASRQGYCFAAKLVRGAYLNAEVSRCKELGEGRLPTQGSKRETDEAYDRLVELLLTSISKNQSETGSTNSSSTSSGAGDAVGVPISIMFATHNGASVSKAVELMEQLNIPRESKAVHFAQIKGMCDNVTHALGLAGYNCSKLITFGPFENLLPWLLRRLEENKDGLAGMQQERHLLTKEIKRRLGLGN